jgi:type IV pilus assembly protein PilF
MNRFTFLLCAILLTACAEQPVTTAHVPQQPTTQEGADAKTRAEIHMQLGAAYFEMRSFGVALEELNEALKADANYGPAHNMLGLVYMELGEDDLAQRSFERALSINAMDSDANNNFGWFLCKRKRHDEGIKYFMAALKNPLYQTPDKSFVNAGLCARERGDDAAAAKYFDSALRVRPAQAQALYQLADLAFQRDALPEARDYLTRLARVGSPLSAEALWLALRVERRAGDRDAEASYGVQLRRNYPNSRETQALLNRQFE